MLPDCKSKWQVSDTRNVSSGACTHRQSLQNMALNSFQLFIGQVQNSPEDLKSKVLQVIFDLLLMYDREFFGRSENSVVSGSYYSSEYC